MKGVMNSLNYSFVKIASQKSSRKIALLEIRTTSIKKLDRIQE